MNVQEAVRLLAIAAVYDNRTPSQAAAQAWAADLEGVTLAEAAAAVREHYTTSPDTWLKAGHVIAIVKRHRRDRARRTWLVELRELRRVDPDDPDAALAAIRRARATAGRQEPERLALLPGKYTDSPAQSERNARGKDAALSQVRKPKLGKPRRGLADLDAAVAELQPDRQEEPDA